MPRKPISKTIRFEVFKRDSFTCQYCGRKAPETILHVDHIDPVAKGGDNKIVNLITSCSECNLGKSDRKLDDNTVLVKQRNQLQELQERKEQLEMMMKWQHGLLDLENDVVEQAAEFWSELASPFHLTEHGRKTLSKLLSKYPLSEVLEAMKIACRQYLQINEGAPTLDSVNQAWDYVPKIANVNKVQAEKPYFKDILYIRGILRNRLDYCNESQALDLLEQAAEAGASIDDLKRQARNVRNWTQWQHEINEFLET